MTSEAAQGTMIAQRTSLRPQKSLLRNCATPRLMTMVRATTATTHTMVFITTVPSIGWFSTAV